VSTSEEKNSAGSYHHGDLRAALVTAAAELVTCCGPAAVSLREVARIVGVSHNAPYRHFPTRQALLAAVAAYGFELLFQEMKATAQIADPAEHLQAIGRAYIAFALRHRGVYQLMFSDEIKKSEHPELRAIAEKAFGSLQQHVVDLNPNLHAGAATVTVWGLVHGIAHLILDNQLKHYDENDPNHNQQVNIATRILIAGLINVKPEQATIVTDCGQMTSAAQ
jgi:AcrR family transcriptional regulator